MGSDMQTIETDYLVIGAGAVGLAFADTLLAESDAHITIVDRHGKPGGHWNDAYGFVALHQPSAFYGVNSEPLGLNRKDTHGPNAGMYELASGPDVTGYFDAVMRRQLLASGRVRYLPMHDYKGDGQALSLLSGAQTSIMIRRKLVNAAYGSPTVPATHTRRFSAADGVRIIAPGELLGLWQSSAEKPSRFVVMGAGKTAMDAIIWLLEAGARPDMIQWIKPRESWLLHRARTQPGIEFFDAVFGGQLAQFQAFAEAESIDDLFSRLEASDVMVRIDQTVTPTMFHYATIAQGEVERLRTVRNVVRLGRVQAISASRIGLDEGDIEALPNALYIDCTASAVEPRPVQPIFQGGVIVPQLVRVPQPCFSAATIAYVEAHYPDDDAKNALCRPVPFPTDLKSYTQTNIVNMLNQQSWMQDKRLGAWIRSSRLDGFGKLVAAVDPADHEKLDLLKRMMGTAPAAVQNLMRLSMV